MWCLNWVKAMYAFVAGFNNNYLWLLARSPQVEPELINRFKTRVSALGFDAEQLIMVKHDNAGVK